MDLLDNKKETIDCTMMLLTVVLFRKRDSARCCFQGCSSCSFSCGVVLQVNRFHATQGSSELLPRKGCLKLAVG